MFGKLRHALYSVDLRRRVDALLDGDDPAGVLDPRALVVAEQLRRAAGTLTDSKLFEAVRTLAWLHWSRYLALPVLPAEEKEAGFVAATALFEVMSELAMETVPDELRPVLEAAKPERRPLGRESRSDYTTRLQTRLRTLHDSATRDHVLDLLQQALRTLGRESGLGRDLDDVLLRVQRALHDHVGRSDQPETLDAVINAARHAARVLKDAERDQALAYLVAGLDDRFDRLGEVSDLNEALSAQRQLVGTTPTDHPEYIGRLFGLVELLRQRYGSVGRVDDLTEAISLGGQVLDGTPDGHPQRAGRLSSHGVALRLRYGRNGQPADLEEAIRLGRTAVHVAAADDPSLMHALSSLCVALRLSFCDTGRVEDLEEAVDVGRRSVQVSGVRPALRAASLNNLGLALQARFTHLGNDADLDEAVDVARQAARTLGRHPGGGKYWTNLSISLKLRFEALGRLEDITEAIEAATSALEMTPPGHPDLPSFAVNLDAVRSVHPDPGSAAGRFRDLRRAFPGPFGALCEDVHLGDLDIWQAEALAPSLLNPSSEDGDRLEDLARLAAGNAVQGEWTRSVVMLRLLVAALAGAPDAEGTGRLARSRAVVGADFVTAAALALTTGANPDLYAKALTTGEWALRWAREAGDRTLTYHALRSLSMLHMLPYTTSRRPETYGLDHERWLRHARLGNLEGGIPGHETDGDWTLTPRPATSAMPEPLDALRTAEAYARAALELDGEAEREADAESLADILTWQAALGADVDPGELAELTTRAPEKRSGTRSRLDTTTEEIIRIAGRPELAEFVRGLAPELSILALGTVLHRRLVEDPEVTAQINRLHAELTSEHGDEQDRVDHAELELQLLHDLHATSYPGMPDLGGEIPLEAIPPLVERLTSGSPETRMARAAILTLVANRLTGYPTVASAGFYALDAAARLAPELLAEHQYGVEFITARLYFAAGAHALYGEGADGSILEIVQALLFFTGLGMPTRASDCLSLIKAQIPHLEARSGLEVLIGLMTLTAHSPNLDPNARWTVQEIFARLLHGMLTTGATPDFLILLFQIAKGWRTHGALAAEPPPVPAFDEAAAGMLAGITVAEGADVFDPEAAFVTPEFLDAETVLVSWSDTVERRPSAGPADRLRNRQRRFDRHLATLMGPAGEGSPSPMTLDEVQACLDERTALLTYYSGVWSDDQTGTAYLLVTSDGCEPEIRTDAAPAGDLRMRVDDLTVTASPLGLLVARLRRQIQQDPMADLVDSDAGEILASGVESFLGRLLPRLEELNAAGRDRLLIVPHGPLHYYPFHLIGPVGAPLADKWNVTYLPNLGLLRKRSAGDRLVPVPDSTIASFGLTYRDTLLPGRQTLANAASEAAEVATIFGAQVTPEASATKTNVLRALCGNRYVHISAHGGHNVDAPSFQSLLLAGIGEEGVLFAHELLRHDLRGLELVTLGACETALGRFDRLDDLQGLPAAFLLAGARAIVGTLWQVSDEAAALFFPALYRRLAQGADIFDAFRAAQVTTRAALPQYWDWGAFYMMGGVAR